MDLPDVIIKHLQSFLSSDDLHYFLNSNKSYFSSLKQEMIYFSLNKEKSREYVENERFREMILSKVKDARKQIGLIFDENYEISNIDLIIAHKINMGRRFPHLFKNVSSQCCFLPTEVKEIPFLPILQDLELGNCQNIQDFSSLSHLKKLQLVDASQLTDITPLQNIPHLSLKKCPNIQDFSVVSSKRQQFLSINRCGITDVYFFRNILEVKLSFCDQLVDVSPLSGIKNLLLSNCSSIRDISGLGNHHRLKIVQCNSIECGYECFRTVRHAGISQPNALNLSVFREVQSLAITFISSMESQLYLLKDIPELELITFFPERKEVCDISSLRSIRLTIYDDILAISDRGFSSQLRHLELIDCDQIEKIINQGKTSIFRGLQYLYISNSMFEHVNGLGDIPNLILEKCFKLHDISDLGRNRCVELVFCPRIRNVSSLATVPIVTVKNCKGIVDYSCLSSVPRLKVLKD